MLAQTIVLVAAFAIFAASAVAGVAGLARAGSVESAKAAILPAVETALAAYQAGVAATMAAQSATNAGAFTAPPAALAALDGAAAFAPARYLETPPPAGFGVAVDVRPTALTVPACGVPGSGPDAAVQLQCSPFVQESRLSLAVTTDAGPLDANGTVSPLAHSRYTVTLRLFAQPPYAIVTGVEDAEDPAGYHEGDDAGWDGALPAFGSPAPDDTTIHVVLRCVPAAGSCAASDPPAPDRPVTTPWTNGNGLP